MDIIRIDQSYRCLSWPRQFCPTCGVTVFTRLEALPGLTGVAVGCFADPTFQAPQGFYWDSRRHHWLSAPQNVKVLQKQ